VPKKHPKNTKPTCQSIFWRWASIQVCLKTSLLALESPRARRHVRATTTHATSIRGPQGVEVHSIKLPWRLCKCKRVLQ